MSVNKIQLIVSKRILNNYTHISIDMAEEIEKYLTERFEPQYEFYDKKAKESRYRFLSFQIIIIVVSAIIPIVNVEGIGNESQIRIALPCWPE